MPMPKRPRDRKECMRWLLQFAAQPIEDFYQPRKDAQGLDLPLPDPSPSVMAGAQKGIEHFIAAARPQIRFGVGGSTPLTGPELRELYSQTKYGLAAVAEGRTWNVPGNHFSVSFGFAAGRGWLDYDGNASDQFLLTCMDLMRSEGKLISKCARNGCGTLFLRSRRARYCGERCAQMVEAERARARRKETSPQQRKARRRRYYLARLKRYDPARWRHLIEIDKQKKQKKRAKTRKSQ
jgi:hypothetical protein